MTHGTDLASISKRGKKMRYIDLDITPTADVAPIKHGDWEEEKITMRDWDGNVVTEKTLWRCSACGYEDSLAMNYCPNCGARMDGVRR